MTLRGRKILVGITGSIAAYKIPLLIRLLKKSGAEVRVTATEASFDFVTPLTLSTLSENPVYMDPFDKRTGAWNSHIELGNWADLFLIAPVSANTLAKMASGLADNLLMTTYLAARCPVFFAPAMDLDMYKHPTTQRNIQIIRTFGHRLIEPKEGELASGLCGAGRMEEPEEILKIIEKYFEPDRTFDGRRILITAGPTYEAIDPVRFIGNHSSGKMGFALASAMIGKGAAVNLVTGPVNLPTPAGISERIDVTSSAEMYQVCRELAKRADIIIMAAAVSDYQPVEYIATKIKKKNYDLHIQLKPTTDILRALAAEKRNDQIIVGFALETDNELENARLKLQNKNLDIIVMNSLRDEGSGFRYDTNKITILDRTGTCKSFDLQSKNDAAHDIVAHIAGFIKSNENK